MSEKTQADTRDETGRPGWKGLSGHRKNANRRNPKSDVVSGRRLLFCPPDNAARRLPYLLFGYLCRILVTSMATGGLAVFVSGAMMFDISNGYILGVSLLLVSILSLFCLGWKTAVAGGIASVALAAWQFVSNGSVISELPYACLALYNGCIRRLESAGYLSFSSLGVTYVASSSEEQLLHAGMAMLILLFALVFTLSLVRRANLILPTVLSTTVLAVILTFNIYSNRVQSNLGILLVISSFAAVLIMSACDRTYRQMPYGENEPDAQLLSENGAQRPPLPDSYLQEKQEAERRRLERRQRRATQHRTRKQTRTVDEELNDYFANDSAKRRMPASGGDNHSEEKHALLAQIRAVRRFDRITDRAHGATGGFAALAALLVCLLAVALPALLIRGNFKTIAPIDEKLSFARDYVTAVLRGDDSKLDELSYQADSAHFAPRSTELEQLSFTGRQILYVKARYQASYYLTGWIGTEYRDGSWQAADNETRLTYRRLFGTDSGPSEALRYNFYRYTKPSLVDITSSDELLDSYKGIREYGFLTVLVHMRRVNSPGSEALLPSVYAQRFGLCDYDSTIASKLGIVNYFDGIRTGRDFKENGTAYATVTDVPVMSNERWASNVAELSEIWAMGREALLVYTYSPHRADAEPGDSLLNLTVAEENDATIFSYTYNVRKDTAEKTFRFYHASDCVTRTPSGYTITEDTGTLTLLVSAGKVLDVSLTGCDSDELPNLLEQYLHHMTDEEREALIQDLEDERAYSDFVYATYTGTSGNDYIHSLASTIRADAHRWLSAEDGSGLYAAPAEVTLASRRDVASGKAFIQRDALVRCVIDYIIRDLGCTYSITPDVSAADPTLDGVENFLRNTKQGYCVQFASAAALLLREYGIPVRYTEGYIAQGLSKTNNSDFVYGGYVHDYEAHAWIEVFFDGIGWITYEATPQYYTGLYGYAAAVGSESSSQDPQPPESSTQPEPVTAEPSETESLPLIETESPIDTDSDNSGTSDPSARRSASITMFILIGIGVLIAVLASVARRARNAEACRRDLAERVLALEHAPEDPRELAHQLCDNVTDLLALYGLSPITGEFPEAYAERLTGALTPQTDSRDRDMPPPLRPVLEALAAEEFGHGMTMSEMKQMAALYLFLHGQRTRFLPLHTRLWQHFIRHRL